MSGLSESSLDSTDASVQREFLIDLLNHAAEPCGEYRHDFRSEWWLCPACGWESERAPHRDPGGREIHQSHVIAGIQAAELAAARGTLGRVRALADFWHSVDSPDLVGAAATMAAKSLTAALDGPIGGGGV